MSGRFPKKLWSRHRMIQDCIAIAKEHGAKRPLLLELNNLAAAIEKAAQAADDEEYERDCLARATRREAHKARIEGIVLARLEHQTFKQIGSRLGITGGRVSAILNKEAYRIESHRRDGETDEDLAKRLGASPSVVAYFFDRQKEELERLRAFKAELAAAWGQRPEAAS